MCFLMIYYNKYYIVKIDFVLGMIGYNFYRCLYYRGFR